MSKRIQSSKGKVQDEMVISKYPVTTKGALAIHRRPITAKDAALPAKTKVKGELQSRPITSHRTTATTTGKNKTSNIQKDKSPSTRNDKIIKSTKIVIPNTNTDDGPKESPSARNLFLKAVNTVSASIKLRKHQTSTSSDTTIHRKPKEENTYRLIPDDNTIFKSCTVEKEMKQILIVNLKDYRYSAFTAKNYSSYLAKVILDKVKTLGYVRYKFVCNVMIGENNGQDTANCSRCLWDDRHDTFAAVVQAEKTFFVAATVYGLYYE